MTSTVFWTVITGVITYVFGQFIVKLVIEPVQEMRKTIGQISHSLIVHANVIMNPGVPTQEVMLETSQQLRQLSSQLQSHLYLVPQYNLTAFIFRLPTQAKVLAASGSLIGLSNSIFRTSERLYEQNARKFENVCDSLGIFMPEGDRWPKDLE